MDFSDFQDLQDLEEETRQTGEDYNDDIDSFYQMEEKKLRLFQMEENKLKQMADEDLKQDGPNKRLMTRDAWEKSREQSKIGEESENVREMEKMKAASKVNKSDRKLPVWDYFVGKVEEDTQPWTPVTSKPRSAAGENV